MGGEWSGPTINIGLDFVRHASMHGGALRPPNVRPEARTPAMTLVIPGVEPMPSNAGTPARTKSSCSANCLSEPWYKPPRSE